MEIVCGKAQYTMLHVTHEWYSDGIFRWIRFIHNWIIHIHVQENMNISERT